MSWPCSDSRCPALTLRIAIVASLFGLSPAASMAGTVRYDLPELLGRYEYGLQDDPLRRRSVRVDTPFELSGASSIKLVLEGTVKPGVAMGDGISYEPTRVVLEPSVPSGIGVTRGMAYLSFGSPQSTSEFRVEHEILGPFRSFDYSQGCDPEVICSWKPPRLIPLYSFTASAGVSPAHTTQTPDVIDGQTKPFRFLDGLIIEVPVVANITEAYAIIEGSGVVPELVTSSTVPEPSCGVLGLASFLLCLGRHRSVRPG